MDGQRALLAVLEDARARGLTGPGPVEAHVDHALAWAAILDPPPDRFLDLGAGGGVPGLVLAGCWPATHGVLLDSRRRATEWLTEAVARLDLEGRVGVVEARAEAAAREPRWREAFPLVVARGFGAPAVTAECASPFVTPGGRLSVSDPPGADPRRWPADPLATLALGPADRVGTGEASFVVLAKTGPVDERWPRPAGRPARSPLWT
jgi:16S rRNA (guanine527-N7)-methyltransferase